MVSEIDQCPSGRQFFADLGHGGIRRIPFRLPPTGERTIAGVEMQDHLAVVGILASLEGEFPMVW